MKKKQCNRAFKRGLTGILVITMVMGVLPMGAYNPAKVQAEGAQIIRKMNLDPSYLAPSDGTWNTSDSAGNVSDHKVYFGAFDDKATAFRVLQVNEEEGTVLLDSDSILLSKQFDEDMTANEGQENRNEWKNSDLELWLNGTDYYENTSVFTVPEKAAIKGIRLKASEQDYEIGKFTYTDYEAWDQVFLLSAKEADSLYQDEAARIKKDRTTGKNEWWWLRSAYADDDYRTALVTVGKVNNPNPGVSPAFKIWWPMILFASVNGEQKGGVVDGIMAENQEASKVKSWKLTIKDRSMTVNVQEGESVVEKDGVVTVPYIYKPSEFAETSKNDTDIRISVMITDKGYAEKGAQVLYYGALEKRGAESNDSVSGCVTGVGAFKMPSVDKQVYSDYKIYLMAEKIHGAGESDYASEPIELTVQ